MLENTGVRTLALTENEIGDLYSGNIAHSHGCMSNEYLVGKLEDNTLVGPWHFDGKKFTLVKFQQFQSYQFGIVKPKNKDPYQIAYFDSLVRNQLTIATGPAGSGKSLIAMAYAFQQMDNKEVDRIVIFTNPWIAESAVKLGFMPGEKIDKLLETSIGSILISKIGSRYMVEQMVQKEQIILMPMGDCRGYEVPDNSFVYFTEAQNTSRYLMKLFLQRTNDKCKIVIEGDERQVDSDRFRNGQNGLARAAELFRGEDYAGHIKLVNIYRGRIAKKAEEM